MKNIAPYGSWPSEITTDLMTAGTVGLSEARLYKGVVYWLELRPKEQGRTAIVCMDAKGNKQELTSSEVSCRSTVHEYGGACYLPTSAGLFFVNHKDQQIYRIDQAGSIEKITTAPDTRFADLSFNGATLLAVAERHSESADSPENYLAIIDVDSGAVSALHQGQDFYSSATFSPDGKKLSWISWMHPQMPWDGTSLWTADIAGGELSNATVVAGGIDESVVQPEWSADGQLYFVSDKNNWWNLYRLSGSGVEPVCARDAEFGLPQWQFGMIRYGFIDSHSILTSFSENGTEKLATIDTRTGVLTGIDREHSSYSSIRTEADRYCYIAQSTTGFPAVYVGDLSGEKLVCASSEPSVDHRNYAVAKSISFPTSDDKTAYGFFYLPVNAEYEAPKDELPPLLVMIHGGPTSATSDSLSLKIQYWTNRGFAVLDVNYRGSTGFGREYRDALKTQWGIADVQDCDFGVRYLVEAGLVDRDRVAIRGGSAGGFTVLAALAHTDSFKAGASLYGVSDLTALASDTHKFESRYLDSLIGPYPEQKDLYLERSPISSASLITSPVLFLQGLEDKVVPPSQAEMMIDSLKKNNVQVAYLPFEGEAHGFRKAETIAVAFAAELWFYGRVFGFEPVGGISAIEFL